MSGRKILLTIPDPLEDTIKASKESLARKLKTSSSLYDTGVFFKGAENNGGNSLGALFPIIHLTSDMNVIRERVENSRKLSKSLVVGGTTVGINQAVFSEQDQVDVANKNGKQYDTNSIILVGCKVLEVGSRTAMGLEQSWRSWTNIGVLAAYLKQEKIEVQNMTFLKQVVPRDPSIFMYCILVNIKIDGFREETKVLSGLQQLRGSVITGYAALYTVMGDISRSKSEESKNRLIETLSGGEGSNGARKKESRAERSRSVNTV